MDISIHNCNLVFLIHFDCSITIFGFGVNLYVHSCVPLYGRVGNGKSLLGMRQFEYPVREPDAQTGSVWGRARTGYISNDSDYVSISQRALGVAETGD